MQNDNSKFKTDLKGRSYQYSIEMIRFLEVLPKDNASIVIRSQLLRSATSVGANIIEAQAASSRKDFTNFMTHSLKSANESLYWLNLLRDAKQFSHPQLDYLLSETNALAKILGASILTLKNKNKF